jgi:hypothetical protein
LLHSQNSGSGTQPRQFDKITPVSGLFDLFFLHKAPILELIPSSGKKETAIGIEAACL